MVMSVEEAARVVERAGGRVGWTEAVAVSAIANVYRGTILGAWGRVVDVQVAVMTSSAPAAMRAIQDPPYELAAHARMRGFSRAGSEYRHSERGRR